jgi:chromosome transmission fidelity protein 1
VVLGMPYPNPSDPELRERMRYLDAAAAAATATAGNTQQPQPGAFPHPTPSAPPAPAAAAAPAPAAAAAASSSSGPLAGSQYYDDLCFKAVNQAVGRVIRHRGDYAAIVLADQRWVMAAGGAAVGAAAAGAGGAVAGGGGDQQGGGRGRGREHPVSKLPGWIRRSFAPTGGEFGAAYRQLAAFYRARKAAEAGV